jgi:cell wall-associated NlpC family hydrolase
VSIYGNLRAHVARTLILLVASALLVLIYQPGRATAAVPLGLRAVQVAAEQQGKPYRSNAAGPRAFDCSGLVTYVYRTRLHQAVPRTADAQWRATLHLAKRDARPGDLIFFVAGGRAYHVGVYAGAGRIWHAPKPGSPVKLARIWTSNYVVGRVR